MNKSNKKQKIGFVVSDKMNKTRVVKVVRLTSHPAYKKTIRKINKFKAHDEKNISKMGDKVRIIETRPLSKDKYWRIAEVLSAKG